MDEIDHLLSSLSDHLGAAEAKSLSDDVDDEVDRAQSIADDLVSEELGHDDVHERVDEILDLLDDIEERGTENTEADRHLAAARRAAERVLDR